MKTEIGTEMDYSFWRELLYDLKYPLPLVLSETRWRLLPVRVRAVLNVCLRATKKIPEDFRFPIWNQLSGSWYDEIPF